MLHVAQLGLTHAELCPVPHVAAVHVSQRVSMILRVEFLKVHAGHELLGSETPAHILLLLLLLLLRRRLLLLRLVHVVVLLMLLLLMLLLVLLVLMLLLMLLNVMLLLLALVVEHHVRLHLVVTHLSIHRPHHVGPLAHGGLHVSLRPRSIVHHLSVGHGSQAGLGCVLLGARLQASVHAHPVAMQTPISLAVVHGHHHVLCHRISPVSYDQ